MPGCAFTEGLPLPPHSRFPAPPPHVPLESPAHPRANSHLRDDTEQGQWGAWASARCAGPSVMLWMEGRVQWGGLERPARLVLSAEGNCCPAQLDGSHQDFFCSQPFPWDPLWGRYNHLHTASCQPCDSYIVPGLVCLQVCISQLSLFPTEDVWELL